ncbi:MAG: hypothetical protein ACR2RE_30605 [Geminicoccaceae bacterium]
MAKAKILQSHRFVLVYRMESREIEGAADVWRGWIERVPDPRQREHGQQTEDRLGFHDLSELPGLVETLISRSETASASTPSKRRSAPSRRRSE